MEIAYIIFWFSVFFWIFPAIRHYKTELFWYFLTLALSDPLAHILKNTTIFRIYDVHLIFVFLASLSLYWLILKKKYVRIILTCAFLLVLGSFFSTSNFSYKIIALIHLLILVFFLMRSIHFIAENSKLNIFHLFLLLYETSIILKILALLTQADTGIIFFYATSIFQILLAIFFGMFKEENSRLLIDLRTI